MAALLKAATLTLVLFGLAGVAFAGGDNRNVPRADVANRFWAGDKRFQVRFTTTTASANVSVCLASTATVLNLSTGNINVTYSPTISQSTSTTYGGRASMIFHVVAAASNVYVDMSSVDISTVTSPYLTQGQWFSPDDPLAWQGELYLKSPSTFTVTGWMFFDKPR